MGLESVTAIAVAAEVSVIVIVIMIVIVTIRGAICKLMAIAVDLRFYFVSHTRCHFTNFNVEYKNLFTE